MKEQTKRFRTEVQQLLDLMIHSLYSNKDIFLRELIANAADALDKARFAALTNPERAREWKISIIPDKQRGTLTIADNGIGMSKDEIIENIGTIAHSGTRAFLAAMEKNDIKESPELIGQFGVGFYSAFMAADKVSLVSKQDEQDDGGTRWESSGKANYTLNDAPNAETGTSVTLHLKPECKSYLEEWKIREIVKTYSDFIEYPIELTVTRKQDEGGEKTETEIINSQKAIWLRPAEDVSEEDHEHFFQHLHGIGKPLRHIQYAAEGTIEFKALLYLPEKAPLDLFMPDMAKHGLHLYVKRVFICDDCPDLLPAYLRFVKGVVEAGDLPLNISREMLQDNPQIRVIQKNLVRKILAELQNMHQDAEGDYQRFYREFGRVIKEGVHSDFENRDKLRELLMFETMNGEPGTMKTLKSYVESMPSQQTNIYYLTGESRKQLENSPHLERLQKNNFDVLFMTDPVDEWVVQAISEFDGKKLVSVAKGDLTLPEDDSEESKKQAEKAAEEHKDLMGLLSKNLEEKVREVRFSQRLTDSACCLVGGEHDPSPQLERLFAAMNQPMPQTKRILELNPAHPLISAMQKCYDTDHDDSRLAEFANLLYDQALLTEGSQIPDPLDFSRRVANLMVAGLAAEQTQKKEKQ